MIKEMLKSKKFWYAVAGVLVVVLGYVIPDYAEMAEKALYGIIALILGQGMSDIGKEAAKLKSPISD